MDDKSITVKMPDGSSKIVIVSESTKVSKTTDGVITDLTNGIQISVVGTNWDRWYGNSTKYIYRKWVFGCRDKRTNANKYSVDKKASKSPPVWEGWTR